jgi:XTP/dITP diphosphohydrolase
MGTNNLSKQAELREILHDLPFDLVSPEDIGLDLRIEEVGSTFLENAALKARTYAAASGLDSLSDDSGLEVEALDAAPGVYSARFGGLGSASEQNLLLLERLKDVPDDRRRARFVCVMAYSTPSGQLATAVGIVSGAITREMRGSNGFGYDPVFLISGVGKTFAELTSKQKNELSHRRRALEKMSRLLREPRNGAWLGVDTSGEGL